MKSPLNTSINHLVASPAVKPATPPGVGIAGITEPSEKIQDDVHYQQLGGVWLGEVLHHVGLQQISL